MIYGQIQIPAAVFASYEDSLVSDGEDLCFMVKSGDGDGRFVFANYSV